MDLAAQYQKWDKISCEDDACPVSNSSGLTPADLKGLSFSLGQPLTEEQFKAHRKANPAQVVGSYRAQ